MKILRILVYEGDSSFMYYALGKRNVKQSKVLPNGTITEAFLSDPVLLGLGFDDAKDIYPTDKKE